MHPQEEQSLDHSRSLKPRRNYDLYFIDHIGARSYLRFTRLGVIVILLLTIVPLVVILLLFITREPIGKINVNITAPPATPFDPNKPVIKPVPPRSPTIFKPTRQPNIPAPTPPALAPPDQSMDKLVPQTSPTQTPRLPSNSNNR